MEDKLMARKEAEENREKQLRTHEERLREIKNSLRRKNIRLIGIPEEAERDRGPQNIFEQIITENFPNLEKETGIRIQEIERTLPPKSIKTVQHLALAI